MSRKRKRRKKDSGWLTTIIVEGLAVLAFIGVYHSNRQVADAHAQQQDAYQITADSLLDRPHPTVLEPGNNRIAQNPQPYWPDRSYRRQPLRDSNLNDWQANSVAREW